MKHMHRYLILAVIAAAALIWSQPPVLAQTATGLSSLAAATAIHDTDTLPLCQNGAPSCSLSSFVWSDANIGQIAAYFAQRTQTVTNYTISCSNNVCTNIPSSALVATGVSAGVYTNANITINSAGQITAAANGSGGLLTTVSKNLNYTIAPGDNGTCFDNGGATAEVDFTLPAYSAGFSVCFTVMSAHILKVIAPNGVQIAMAPNITGAGGSVQDTTLYDTLSLIAPAGGSTVYVARAFTGTGWSMP